MKKVLYKLKHTEIPFVLPEDDEEEKNIIHIDLL